MSSGLLARSIVSAMWWGETMDYFCYLRDIQDRLADIKSPCEKRSGTPCDGPVTPFGAEICSGPISTKDKNRLHQFGTKVLPGKFFGYALNS